MARFYAFWQSHAPTTDRPAATTIERYGPLGIAALGAFGILTALLVPLMLVIERHDYDGSSNRSYNGFFINCVLYPIKYHDLKSGCKFYLFPSKVKESFKNMSPCFYGEGKDGFTYQTQHDLFVGANFFALLCLCLSFIAVVFIGLRGRGFLPSARASFTSSLLCGLSGSVAIILYYVAAHPCKGDMCAAMNAHVAFLGATVTCWALSPVGHVIAMLMVFVGGCCSQRWAANHDAEERAPLTADAAVAEMTEVDAPAAPPRPHTPKTSTSQPAPQETPCQVEIQS